jgi:hypothetical protein
MIQYALKCAEGHGFDSWFQSAEAFDKLAAAGMVSCAVCGIGAVSKSVMAPAVRGERKPLAAPRDAREEALAELRRRVTENSDYVGMNFAAEARAIHEGTAPERAIYGEARPEEARRLIEDGVPAVPLPFLPARKTN